MRATRWAVNALGMHGRTARLVGAVGLVGFEPALLSTWRTLLFRTSGAEQGSRSNKEQMAHRLTKIGALALLAIGFWVARLRVLC